MSYNPKFYEGRKLFWQELKIGRCPIMGCEGKLVEEDNTFYCDTCTQFLISKKKFFRLGGKSKTPASQ